MRVFEFAKSIDMETLALMDKIKKWKLPVKSHMAALDDETMDKIKSKLEEESVPAKKTKAKKKTAKKKTATAAKKKTAKKKVVKKAGTTASKKKTKTTKTVLVTRKAGTGAEKATTLVTKKDPGEGGKTKVISRKSTVVRKKAAAPAPEVEAEGIEPTLEGLGADTSVVAGGEEVQAQGAEPTEAPASEATAPRVRKNIIGKMDLSKAKPPSRERSDRGGQQGNRPGGAARNIRAGFFAEPIVTPDEESPRNFEKKDKDRAKKPAPGAGAGKEEAPPAFISSDFRKREVIFQPRKRKVVATKDMKKTLITVPKASKRVVKVFGSMSVGELAGAMGVKAPQVIKKLMAAGEMANMNSTLDFDTISLIVGEFNYEAENVQITPDELINQAAFGELDAELVGRPPVVTVMGHVDHGKTSLLDAIRNADVASGEAGGITQHIGAYKVKIDSGHDITFLDTPGHEAFTAMRARGANVTDIAVIVVAADDGVMPQTAEAINHAKAAGVPIIMAVNKMDKEGANVDRIKQQLTEYEIVPEEWGGTHIFVPCSAIQKEGIKELLEQIMLVAEVEDLKANPKRAAVGTIVEAKMEKGRGPVSTVLVGDGTLSVGDYFVAGTCTGRVRAMMNDRGEQVKQALPGEPVEVLGFDDVPLAGDQFNAVKSEESAQGVAKERQRMQAAEKEAVKKGNTLEELFSKVKLGEQVELPVILKADVSGSIEAIKGMVEKANTDEVVVKIIHEGVGGISESDVLLSSTSGGLIIGFNVRPDSVAVSTAKEKGVEIKAYTIVYNLIDDLKKAMAGLLKPDEVEKHQGRAEVREVFGVPKLGNIAGCSVTDGLITRNDLVRLVRDGTVVYEGKLGSLRRFKDDVKEVKTGFECGIGIENFNDIKAGDILETYIIEQVSREL